MVVDFNFTTVGLRVTFKNLSDGVPLGTKYQWDFGDGETSFQKNPVHHYKCAGDYSVTLQVIDNDTKEILGQSEDDILITDFVKTHLPCSIYCLIDTYIPKNIFGTVSAKVKRQFITKWQLYIQPLVNHCIPIEQYANELYYEALENELIMELAAYDYMVLQVNLMVQATAAAVKDNNAIQTSSSSSSKNPLGPLTGQSSSTEQDANGGITSGRVKKIQTGPTEVEYFDDAAQDSDFASNAIKALGEDGTLDVLKENICMLAERLDIYLPICNRPSAKRVVPRVVNRRNPGFLGGPDPVEPIL